MNTFIMANPQKCIGCKACEIACAVAHLDVSVSTAGATALPFIPRMNLVRTPYITMPIQCRQCDDAPCANICAEGAIIHRNGINIVDDDKCIGCKKCMVACPFGMIDIRPKISNGELESQNGLRIQTAEGEQAKEVFVTYKCDLCSGRKGGPACIEVCPAGAFTTMDHSQIITDIRKKRLAAALDIANNQKK